jgi:hypothetical protein
MAILYLLPVILSAVLLGAHFLRAGMTLLVVVSLAFPFLLIIRRTWAVRLVQIILVSGAFEWVRTLTVLVAERRAIGQPWIRLAVILGVVAAFTGSSALLFFWSSTLRRRYGLSGAPTEGSGET